MPKPDWLRDNERRRHIAFRKCITCNAGGDLVGQTNPIPKVGRLNRYRCRRHPSVIFYDGTLACEDWQAR